MELLNRYLQAVKFWLPKEHKQDIIAELSEDLRSQIEEKEAELGRPLSDVEIEVILKHRGRPVLVANRYLPQEYLIGPVLFPVYIFVLKIVGLCYLVPWFLVWIGIMSASSSYRAKHLAAGWLMAMFSAWRSLWLTAFIALGVVTIVFAVLERVQAKSGFLEEWNPRKLPAVRNPNQIPRSGSLIEFAFNVVLGVWWIGNVSSRLVFNRFDLQIYLSSPWRYFSLGFVLITLVNLGLIGMNLARPYWTPTRASIRLTIDLIGSALFCWLLRGSIVSKIIVANVPEPRLMEITTTINLLMSRAFPYAVAVGLGIAISDVYRIVRTKAKSAALRPETAELLSSF